MNLCRCRPVMVVADVSFWCHCILHSCNTAVALQVRNIYVLQLIVFLFLALILLLLEKSAMVNGILRNWESLCDIRPDCHHHLDASGTSNAMFDELAERSLISPLAGTKHTYVRLTIIIHITFPCFYL